MPGLSSLICVVPVPGCELPLQPSVALPPLPWQPAFGSDEVQLSVNGTPGAKIPVLDEAVMVTVRPPPPPELPLDEPEPTGGCGPPLAEQPARARPATVQSASAARRRVLPIFKDMTGSL